MRRKRASLDNNAVSISALDIFANAVGALAFLLLLFAVNAIEMARPMALRVLTKRVQASQVGTDYITVLAAVGGMPPYSWSLHSGSLPEGLQLDQARGEIAGSPNASAAGGSFPFEVMVSDARKKWARSRLELRVLPRRKAEEAATQPLVLLTHGELPGAFTDKSYALYLSARGGSGRYRWSAEGLPQGLTVAESSGLLNGTPEVPGAYELILRVRDEQEGSGDAGQAMATASLQISGREETPQTAQATPGPRILTEAVPTATEAEPYEVMMAGTGLDPLRWSAQNLPPGLHINERGVIRGTPRSVIRAQVAVAMEDARGLKAAARTVLLTVKPRPISVTARIRERGIWGWVVYPLLALGEVAFLFFLRRRANSKFDYLLRSHNVHFIKKPDGTTALSGEQSDMESVRRQVRQIYQRHRRYRMISFALLTVAIAGYTIFLLR